MLRVAIIGTGNLARHLYDAFSACPTIDIIQIVGRNTKELKHFVKSAATSTDFKNIAEADVYIVAVSDTAIPIISKYLTNKEGLVAHTAGSVSIDILSGHHRYGVFYPLQTFSKGRKVDMTSVPFCLEAHDESDLALLKRMAGEISKKHFEVDSQQRKSLHLAAVFVNNFTNHLYQIGKEICDEKELPFDILHPLIRETADKLEQLSPYDAQTGPARRGDSETIEKHLKQLKNPEYKKVYEVLSESIETLYGENTNPQNI